MPRCKACYNKLRQLVFLITPQQMPYTIKDQNEMTIHDLDQRSHSKLLMSMSVPPLHSHMLKPNGFWYYQGMQAHLQTPVGWTNSQSTWKWYKVNREKSHCVDSKYHNASIYAQFNIDENEYLQLDCLIDEQKDPTTISLDEQQAVYNGREHLKYTTQGWFICSQSNDGFT